MRIETDIKIGFKDVMIRPKRSTLKSRSQVSLIRKFNFLHSDLAWEGIPIMAANMDTVGTFEMAKALGDHKLFTTIHKHYSPEEWKDFYLNDHAGIKDFIAISSGTSPNDSEKLKTIRGEVIDDYQNFLEENWISDLRATSKIKIRKRALKKLIKFYEIK